MSADLISTSFIEDSGLLEMADANQIVLLLPQVSSTVLDRQDWTIRSVWSKTILIAGSEGGAHLTNGHFFFGP